MNHNASFQDNLFFLPLEYKNQCENELLQICMKRPEKAVGCGWKDGQTMHLLSVAGVY